MNKFRITNGVMFALVMEDEQICRHFLERLFPGKMVEEIHVTEKVEISPEMTIIPNFDGKCIRMDVVFQNDTSIYDIEMQAANQKFLAKRMRYYSGAMDVKTLKSGDSYGKLKPSYIIFICDFDFFNRNEPLYHFENWDYEKGLQLADESYKILLNTTCSSDKIPKELKAFFDYVHSDVVSSDDELVKEMDARVKKLSKQKGVKNVMTLYEDFVMRSQIEREEGLKEGQQQAKAAIASNLKKAGLDLKLISENTGLSLEEVEKL